MTDFSQYPALLTFILIPPSRIHVTRFFCETPISVLQTISLFRYFNGCYYREKMYYSIK